MEKLVIEITLPKTEFKQLVTVNSFPIKIGRGYDNDVIIQDDYVSDKHLEISYTDNQIAITDLNSENGSFFNKNERIESRREINPGNSITIGKTNIKILLPDQQITKTKRLNVNKSFSNRYKIVIAAWIFVLLNVLVEVLISHSTTFRETKFLKLFNSIPTDILTYVLWAGFFTFIGRLFKKETVFHKQLLYVGVFSVILAIYPYLKEIILFNFPTTFWKIFLDNFATLPVIIIFFIFTMKDSTKLSLKSLKLSMPLIVVAFSLFIFFSDYVSSLSYSSKLSYEGSILPKYFKIAKAKSIDDFCLKSEALFEQTDIEE